MSVHCGSVELCVLASGSSGNCTAVRTPGGVVLLDAGLGPRNVAQRLAGTGVGVADVAAIVLTHLDRDHINYNWFAPVARRGVRLFCHVDGADQLTRAARDRGIDLTVETFGGDAFEPVPGLAVHPIPLAHDAEGSHGFVLDGFGCRIGFATDLGHVPESLVDRFCDAGGLDLLAIESNYDQRMQIDSPRPSFLKRRIMGGHGHLSNEQAFEAVKRIMTRTERAGGRLPQHVVLLHRSRDCNCPEVVRTLFNRDSRIAPRLVLAEQHARSAWLHARREKPFVGEQLALAWG